jgi:hypothetical protein
LDSAAQAIVLDLHETDFWALCLRFAAVPRQIVEQ